MRVLIVEDSVLLREGLVRLLADAGHDVVAALPDAHGLSDAVTEDSPDLAILDVRLPPTFTDEGIRAALELRRTRPDLPVMVLSQYVEERYAADLIATRAPGLGYLLKDRVADVADFLDSITTVGAGGTVLDPEVVAQLLTRRRVDHRIAALTDRESEVLALMAQGRSNQAIASCLHLGSVEKHISSLFTKLGLEPDTDDNRRVLAVLAHLQANPASERNHP